jgi:acetyl esterase
MPAPLDPVIAQIIPLLRLRDPATMTPQSARESLRALAAARAAMPPPSVDAVQDIKVKGGDGLLDARVYRVGSAPAPTVVFFHGGGWVAGDLETHDRQARFSDASDVARAEAKRARADFRALLARGV